jgi:hypothetical protein
MSVVAHFGPLLGLLTVAGAFGLTVESWLRRQDLRALNFQYEMLCAQMATTAAITVVKEFRQLPTRV